MDQLIIYGSQYGTTQRYAERFSQLTRLPWRSKAAQALFTAQINWGTGTFSSFSASFSENPRRISRCVSITFSMRPL